MWVGVGLEREWERREWEKRGRGRGAREEWWVGEGWCGLVSWCRITVVSVELGWCGGGERGGVGVG